MGPFRNIVRDENNLKTLLRNYERASLVPAAAVIPALRMNVNVAAVKTRVANITNICN